MVIRNKSFNARVIVAGIALSVFGGASVIAADQAETGAAAGAAAAGDEPGSSTTRTRRGDSTHVAANSSLLSSRRSAGLDDWRRRRDRWLAETGRAVVALDEVHLDVGRLVDAQQRIVVEVTLLRRAVRKRDLELCGAQCVHHGPFDLVFCTTEIQDRSNVDAGVDLLHLDVRTVGNDLRDMRDEATMIKMKSHTHASASVEFA